MKKNAEKRLREYQQTVLDAISALRPILRNRQMYPPKDPTLVSVMLRACIHCSHAYWTSPATRTAARDLLGDVAAPLPLAQEFYGLSLPEVLRLCFRAFGKKGLEDNEKDLSAIYGLHWLLKQMQVSQHIEFLA